ncbi:receptor-type tyrosine-protein phosphatase epsilon [Magallana gigas]|uniref:receptor-type tyrosine-protein phosphatase epsilon n=1 Tax=Magallana gigas TaxID=29159 RepID=UPI003340C60A
MYSRCIRMYFLIALVLLLVTRAFSSEENIALGKPTWQEHPWPDPRYYSGDNAVDGLYTDRSLPGDQCSMSANYQYTATWRVDLGNVFSISHINIYYTTDNQPIPTEYARRMAGFYLYVSNTTLKETGHLCFHENQTKQKMILEDISINCSVSGRYVIYYNERRRNVKYPGFYSKYAYNELCEVEVYGCNVSIHNEDIGKNRCPKNCQEGQCDINTGHCLKCILGLQGPLCDQNCKDNDCPDPCDTDCVNQSCHQRTGNCFSKINITNKSIMTTSDAEKIGPTIIFIACGIVAAVIIIIIAIVGIVLYKRIKTTKGEQEETKRRKNNITESTTKNTFPNFTSYSSHTSVNIDIEDSLAQPEFSKSPSTHGEGTKNFSQIIELSGEDVDIDEKIHDENPYGDLYINEKPIPDIAVDNLGNIIEENSRNEDDCFKKNYSTLLYGERYPCEIGKLPENITKNRFKTTFPYDHSRIKLANKESDYINANYIDGFRQENCYIATQGPTQNTVGDFWLMVWQEHVEQIVMLTNLMEGPKSKCFQYWPDLEETMVCDMFTLHTDTERHYACYSIRKLRLTYNEEQNESRTITQYHYTAWPDHGTPDPLCLLMFHNHVTRTKLGQLKVPTLVHCSAGIGRTGTYIAIDALYEEGQQKSKINIAEYVRKMREKRMNMVQTYEQYKTIFLTLHEMFKAPVGVQTANDYLKSQSAKSNHPAYVSSLREEFQRLLSIRHQYSEIDFKMALQYKSLSTSILPLDKYVVFLPSSVPKRGNYINAIFLPSLTCQNAFIATHYPTTGDSVDFIRLITDYESNVVVCMDSLCYVEFANEWLPTATESKTVSPYTIKQQQELSTGFKCRKLEISKEKSSDEVWVVEIIEPNGVLSQDNPETTSQILGLVSFVQNVKTDNPVTVVSRDGAALCGVFCAVYNLIQQLTMDEEIDVFSVVRLLQTRRPELCSTMEEYIMVHDSLMKFLDKNK